MVKFDQWLLPVLLTVIHYIYAAQVTVPVTCVTREGNSVLGVNKISSVSCQSGETLVSCGIKGRQHIGGARVDPNDDATCKALSHYNQYSVTAEAVCCQFPAGSVTGITTKVTSPGHTVTAKCDSNSYLTGCQVYYVSGPYNLLRGSYSGPANAPPQTSQFISTNNQCNAESKSGNTKITGGATCISLSRGYSLECQTKATFTNFAFYGTCPSGYEMFGCNTYTTTTPEGSLDSYYRNSAGKCFVQQDNSAKMYANAICCRLRKETDPCAGVKCEDGDACNGLETCDSKTGKCIPGTPIICDDGDKCNGQETCQNGQCMSGFKKECKFAEECIPSSGECIAKCDVFDIDGYLDKCSNKYDENKKGVQECKTSIAENKAEIGKNKVAINELGADIDSNSKKIENNKIAINSNTKTIRSSVQDTKRQIDEVKAALIKYIDDKFKKVNDRIDKLTISGDTTPMFILDVNNTDLLLIGLLICNTVIIAICVLYCCTKSQPRGHKYKVVDTYSENEELQNSNRI